MDDSLVSARSRPRQVASVVEQPPRRRCPFRNLRPRPASLRPRCAARRGGTSRRPRTCGRRQDDGRLRRPCALAEPHRSSQVPGRPPPSARRAGCASHDGRCRGRRRSPVVHRAPPMAGTHPDRGRRRADLAGDHRRGARSTLPDQATLRGAGARYSTPLRPGRRRDPPVPSRDRARGWRSRCRSGPSSPPPSSPAGRSPSPPACATATRDAGDRSPS